MHEEETRRCVENDGKVEWEAQERKLVGPCKQSGNREELYNRGDIRTLAYWENRMEE